MNQRPYRLRSSSAGPRPSGPAETERLAQVVMLDHHKESMPGREVRVSTHDVAAEAGMRVEVASSDTAEIPWGLSSSPHFNTTTQQKPTSLSLAPTCPARTLSSDMSLPLVHGPSHTFVCSQPIVHDSVASPHLTALSQPESALTDVKGVEEEGEEEEELGVESPHL